MKSMNKTSFLITTFCFTLVTLSFFVSINLQKVLTRWGQEIEMTVFLENLSASEQEQIISEIKKIELVKQVHHVTQQEALVQLQAQSAQVSAELLQDKKLLSFIPPSLILQFEPIEAQKQKHALENIAQKIQNISGVDEVNYGQDWIDNYAQFVYIIQAVAIVISLIILLASLFVIGNVIYTTIDSRREEIAVLELIGASFAMIRKPFLIQGLALGFIAGVISLLLTWVLYSTTSYQLKTTFGFKNISDYIQYFSISQFLIFCLFYSGIGFLSAYICVRWMNNGRLTQKQVVD